MKRSIVVASASTFDTLKTALNSQLFALPAYFGVTFNMLLKSFLGITGRADIESVNLIREYDIDEEHNVCGIKLKNPAICWVFLAPRVGFEPTTN